MDELCEKAIDYTFELIDSNDTSLEMSVQVNGG